MCMHILYNVLHFILNEIIITLCLLKPAFIHVGLLRKPCIFFIAFVNVNKFSNNTMVFNEYVFFGLYLLFHLINPTFLEKVSSFKFRQVR